MSAACASSRAASGDFSADKQAMIPYRFRKFERIAFTLVVMFALGCTVLIAYENHPDAFRNGLQYGKDALQWTGQYTMACAAPQSDECERLASQ
jgi:hypothetical protein